MKLGHSFALCCLSFLLAAPVQAATLKVEANQVVELTFAAARAHDEIFVSVVLDVEFSDSTGTKMLVPGYWSGGNQWKVRYASPLAGVHRWRSVCNAADDAGLHGVEGSVEVTPSASARSFGGNNQFVVPGLIRAASDNGRARESDHPNVCCLKNHTGN